MEQVWKRSQHKGSDLLLLLAIADNADEMTGEAYPGIPYLAAKTRLSDRAVQYAVARLIKGGELQLLQRGGRQGGKARANLYRVSVQKLREGNEISLPNTQDSVPNTQPVAPQPSVEPSVDKEARVIFDFWLEVMGKGAGTKFNPKRQRAVKARLKDGRDVGYIKRAILNCSKDPWHMKLGDEAGRPGSVHNELELICRDDNHLESFWEMAAAKPPSDHGKYWGDPE